MTYHVAADMLCRTRRDVTFALMVRTGHLSLQDGERVFDSVFIWLVWSLEMVEQAELLRLVSL